MTILKKGDRNLKKYDENHNCFFIPPEIRRNDYEMYLKIMIKLTLSIYSSPSYNQNKQILLLRRIV